MNFSLIKTLRNAVVAFFSHDLGMERRPEGLSLVLNPRVNQRVGVTPVKQDKEQEELQQILSDLDTLMDLQPGSRQAFRHIVYLRRTLKETGLQALHKIPLDVLESALVQLEAMVTNWSAPGLANLRSKMAVAVIDREQLDPEADGYRYGNAAVLDSLPPIPMAPEVVVSTDHASLAAAYAALSASGAPTGLGSQPAGASRAAAPERRATKQAA
jgi:hypothetical protein